VRRQRLLLALAALAVALSPATLLAQEPGEDGATAPSDPAPTEPAPPEEETPPAPAPSEPPPTEEPAPPPEAPPVAEEPAPPATPVLRQGGISVSMLDFSYSPASIQIDQGGSVTWVNNGEEPHTATGDGFDTGEIAPGGSGSATFNTAGDFPYLCTLHPNMTGTVTVLASDDGGGSDGGDDGDDDGTAPGPTEEQVVSDPTLTDDGDLPATGEETGLLAALGMMLLALGLELFAAGRLLRRR
jgi:LPXTG-motif cell wall-anchored protein